MTREGEILVKLIRSYKFMDKELAVMQICFVCCMCITNRVEKILYCPTRGKFGCKGSKVKGNRSIHNHTRKSEKVLKNRIKNSIE